MDKDQAAAPEQRGELPEPAAWLVCSVNGDGSLMVEHSTAWEQAAHDHINDAINEHDIEDAATWVVRPAYTADQLRTAIAAERARTADTHAAYCHSQQQFHDAVAELSTLRQHLAEAGRDVERMQFMEKDVYMLDAVSDPDSLVQVWVGPKQRLSTGRTVRAAIDAAIAAQVEAKPPGVERELFEGE